MDDTSPWYRPRPDLLILFGTATALFGYLTPWFRRSTLYVWWYSGLAYLEEGGGWTWLVVVLLVIAIGASLWAGRSVGLALFATAAAMAGMFLAGAVVAMSLAMLPERPDFYWVGQLPFGWGIPLMAFGFGATIAGALAAVRRDIG
ncbi:hypothetical protein ABZS52_14200 [Micromonospora profundi]|uniref:hypothetical protein n=1 Tax=Micromonospora profundi TaxID=1420889 RepID=UPI0033ADDFD7